MRLFMGRFSRVEIVVVVVAVNDVRVRILSMGLGTIGLTKVD